MKSRSNVRWSAAGMTVVLALTLAASSAAMAQGQGRGGGHPGKGGGGSGGGGWQGGGQPAYGGGGSWQRGGGYGGGYRGGYAYAPRGYGGAWWGGGAYLGVAPWYGYGYASPYAYPYPYAGYYAYPGYYPYPVVVDAGPTVYIQRPPVVVAAPPPPPPQVAMPNPAPQLERYRLSARELFAFDHANLQMPQPKLDEIASALNSNPQITRVTITGYTDRLGSESYNMTLSQRRADAVKRYLVGKGVAADRLVAIGRGEANPLVECHDKDRTALIACLEPNRRVEVEQITVERRIG